MPARCTRYLLFWLLIPFVASANPFLEAMERATPANRVMGLMTYFDTCRVVTQREAHLLQIFDTVDAIAVKKQDEQLRRYCRFYRAIAPKIDKLNNAQKAALFLTVGQQATDDGDPQIAAVCQHFAGLFYYWNEEYGKAFEHLLAANKAFRKIGYGHIPAISRYLYELAFTYYFFAEYEKVIELLTEAARYPPYNPNLAIQTYNTMGMANASLAATKDPALFCEAERSYQKVNELASRYGDSLWVGIATGNLADLYEKQQQWARSLRYYLRSYQTGLKFARPRFAPSGEALSIASLYLRFGQRDSCAYYLNRALTLQRLVPRSGNRFEDESIQKDYYDVARQYYRAIGDFPKAYAFSDSLMVLDKRISQRYKSDQTSLVQQKLLIQKHQAEVDAIEAEKQAQRTLFWIVAVGLALLAGLFWRLYHLSRLRRRQERVIEAEKEKSLRLEK